MSLNKTTWDCDGCGSNQDETKISFCKECYETLEEEIKYLKEEIDILKNDNSDLEKELSNLQ